MSADDSISRSALPIPSRPRTGLITYDAKDPDTKYPPIEQLRPPKGAPNVLVILIDDVGFGASSAFGGPCQTPTRRAAGGGRAEVQPLPHDGALLADASGAADRPQPPLGRHGRHHRDRDRLARLLLGAAEHRGAARQDAEAERLRHRAVRQVPRGAGLADESRPARSTPGRPAAAASSTSTASSAARRTSGIPSLYEGTTPDRSEEDARRGLPLHGGHDRQGDRLDRPAEGADSRQAVLHLLRARRDACAAPRAEGVGRQVQGQVRRGLGQASRRDLRAAEEARRHSRRLRADQASRADSGVGRDAGGAQAGAAPPDGGLCRLPRVRRPPCRPSARQPEAAADPRRHARSTTSSATTARRPKAR